MDQHINDRGIHLDRKLLDAAIKIAKAVQREIDEELCNITEDAVSTVNQKDKIQAWLASHDCIVTDLQKATLQKALTRSQLPAAARRVIELRLDGALAAARKLQTMKNWMAEDDRIRGCFRYHGASPGRFTSLGVQVQNLKSQRSRISAQQSRRSRPVISIICALSTRNRCRSSVISAVPWCVPRSGIA
jgi:DNA polymerase